MALTIKLPTRTGTLEYNAEQVADIMLTLADTPKGEGVVVDDAQDSEAKARVRAKRVREYIIAHYGGTKVKTHAIKTGDDVFVPVVSLPVGEGTDINTVIDEEGFPAATVEPADETTAETAAENGTAPVEPAAAEPAKPKGKK